MASRARFKFTKAFCAIESISELKLDITGLCLKDPFGLWEFPNDGSKMPESIRVTVTTKETLWT